MKVDFLVVGAGIAGLNYAIHIAQQAPKASILVIAKNTVFQSNTHLAQGGIAVVTSKEDSYLNHVNDTLEAGDYLNDLDIVKTVIRNGPKSLKKLLSMGVKFDRNQTGSIDLGIEGGHSTSRVAHCKDQTGKYILSALLEQVKIHPNIEIKENCFATDLITESYVNSQGCHVTACKGVYVLTDNKATPIHATVTLLAGGGIGQIFGKTTNPSVATGDTIAMAYRAGARISNMEFIQFHPTALDLAHNDHFFLITEALRGAGAVLINEAGERFMHLYDKRLELAPRDVVSRAINEELKLGQVYLDCSRISRTVLQKHFPTIYERCLMNHLDMEKDLIPVTPVQHYCCGGIKVDHFGKTNLENLFACGECAETGLHGANRLASNSLLEACVFSERSALKAIEAYVKTAFEPSKTLDSKVKTYALSAEVLNFYRTTLQNEVWHSLGVKRSNASIRHAWNKLNYLEALIPDLFDDGVNLDQPCYELRNMITVAKLITHHARKRKSNKGTHYNIDHADFITN